MISLHFNFGNTPRSPKIHLAMNERTLNLQNFQDLKVQIFLKKVYAKRPCWVNISSTPTVSRSDHKVVKSLPERLVFQVDVPIQVVPIYIWDLSCQCFEIYYHQYMFFYEFKVEVTGLVYAI